MRKGESIRRYATDDLKAMRRRGDDRTDWAKVDVMTEADLERAIAEDEDERDLDPDWTRAELAMPRPRQSVHLRLDPEVVDFFKAGGKGHITGMQAVLPAYVEAQKRVAKRRVTDRDRCPAACSVGAASPVQPCRPRARPAACSNADSAHPITHARRLCPPKRGGDEPAPQPLGTLQRGCYR